MIHNHVLMANMMGLQYRILHKRCDEALLACQNCTSTRYKNVMAMRRCPTRGPVPGVKPRSPIQVIRLQCLGINTMYFVCIKPHTPHLWIRWFVWSIQVGLISTRQSAGTWITSAKLRQSHAFVTSKIHSRVSSCIRCARNILQSPTRR